MCWPGRCRAAEALAALPQRSLHWNLRPPRHGIVGYLYFDGGRTNYDGFGRNAKDNNTLFFMGWIMFLKRDRRTSE
jgi:hypothetical protein